MTIVNTKYGKIQGYTENGLEIFKGIPYAEAPIGELRFSPPIAKKPWDGVLNASKFGPCAYQTIPLDEIPIIWMVKYISIVLLSWNPKVKIV